MGWCELCGCFSDPFNPIERHHVFGGNGRRQVSEKYKMVAHICARCHRGPEGVHNNRELDLRLKRRYQRIFEETHSRKEFMSAFGRNYLLDDEEKEP